MPCPSSYHERLSEHQHSSKLPLLSERNTDGKWRIPSMGIGHAVVNKTGQTGKGYAKAETRTSWMTPLTESITAQKPWRISAQHF